MPAPSWFLLIKAHGGILITPLSQVMWKLGPGRLNDVPSPHGSSVTSWDGDPRVSQPLPHPPLVQGPFSCFPLRPVECPSAFGSHLQCFPPQARTVRALRGREDGGRDLGQRTCLGPGRGCLQQSHLHPQERNQLTGLIVSTAMKCGECGPGYSTPLEAMKGMCLMSETQHPGRGL